MAKKTTVAYCKCCGKKFERKSVLQLYCSHQCQNSYKKAAKRDSERILYAVKKRREEVEAVHAKISFVARMAKENGMSYGRDVAWMESQGLPLFPDETPKPKKRAKKGAVIRAGA